MYYGEELGMRTTDPARIEDVHDPIGKLGWPKEKGRDGERTPMQWTASTEAGFTSSTKPWLPIPSSAATYNLQQEKQDPDSIFNTYRRLIDLRKSEPALRDGTYQAINEEDPNVFAYLRKSNNSTILIALNMSAEPRTITLNINGNDSHPSTIKPLYSSPTYETKTTSLNHLTLAPFGVLVATVK